MTDIAAARVAVTRRALLFILIAGFLGAGIELLLLEHTEDTWQWVPLVLIPPSVVALLVHAARGSSRSRATVYLIMSLNALAGIVGTFLHYRGNVEFELEMYPRLSGFALFRDAMMGATPALAPGSMTMLGFLGLLYAWLTPLASASRN